MAIEIRPATDFDDLRNRALQGKARGRRVRQLLKDGPLGVLAYESEEVVGWAAVAPRAGTPSRATQDSAPRRGPGLVGVVHPGAAGAPRRGDLDQLLAGTVEFARERGAPAIEGYPVDNQGAKVDLTMAYVGTRSLFERAGFEKASDTDSVLDGFPRVLMRRQLS